MLTQNTRHDNELIESKLLTVEVKDIKEKNKLKIPEGITVIGENACQNIINYSKMNPISIEIPNTVESIEKEAFHDLVIDKVIFPINLVIIGEGAFSETVFKEEVRLPENLTKIEDHCFYGSRFLDQLILPKKLKKIGYEAFSFCFFDKEVKIPNSIKEIESYAFYKSNYDRVNVPNCKIDYCAFSNGDMSDEKTLIKKRN